MNNYRSIKPIKPLPVNVVQSLLVEKFMLEEGLRTGKMSIWSTSKGGKEKTLRRSKTISSNIRAFLEFLRQPRTERTKRIREIMKNNIYSDFHPINQLADVFGTRGEALKVKLTSAELDQARERLAFVNQSLRLSDTLLVGDKKYQRFNDRFNYLIDNHQFEEAEQMARTFRVRNNRAHGFVENINNAARRTYKRPQPDLNTFFRNIGHLSNVTGRGPPSMRRKLIPSFLYAFGEQERGPRKPGWIPPLPQRRRRPAA